MNWNILLSAINVAVTLALLVKVIRLSRPTSKTEALQYIHKAEKEDLLDLEKAIAERKR